MNFDHLFVVSWCWENHHCDQAPWRFICLIGWKYLGCKDCKSLCWHRLFVLLISLKNKIKWLESPQKLLSSLFNLLLRYLLLHVFAWRKLADLWSQLDILFQRVHPVSDILTDAVSLTVTSISAVTVSPNTRSPGAPENVGISCLQLNLIVSQGCYALIH